jgi:prophage antirepressor-like protein
MGDIFGNFVLNGHITKVLWVDGKPYFRPGEVGKILELRNIHSIIKKYDDTEKKKLSVSTKNGTRDLIFLTENGLFCLIYRSNRNDVVGPFQRWVGNILTEIRTTGTYTENMNYE